MPQSPQLPPNLIVFERGWLSANNILFIGSRESALVDSGYCTHSPQTLSLVGNALGPRPLDLLLNTHLHSDHCGGNFALQSQYPSMRTLIPPGEAAQVRDWNVEALTYLPTGQQCPRFGFDGVITAGREVMLGDHPWEVHGSPGHDQHSVILFEPVSRTLISADSLWENGFGVVFQELEGAHAFDEVSLTLDVIQKLDPLVVIPGHGRVFSDINQSLQAARRRLDSFVRDPARHANHAAKVLLKFKLLELQRIRATELLAWACSTPYFLMVHKAWFGSIEIKAWVEQLAQDLARVGAATLEGEYIVNG